MRAAALLVLFAGTLSANPLTGHLRTHGKSPAEYVLSKLDQHRIVILGESHWVRHDAELVASLVPELRRRGIALAMEFWKGADQRKIDRLLDAPEWDPGLALEILVDANWPYVQYRDILEAAWCANREPSAAPPMRIIAMGPPDDWRERKIGYDAFMADRVLEYATGDGRRVLAYCGMHHAFTKYLQVERRIGGRVTEFMTRFGNILWRAHGENVFLIALHKPESCGPERACLPLGGMIDCAAAPLGFPVGFDILGSPVAEAKFPPESFYAAGHPLLRMIDYADGYIWSAPIDETRMVDVLPIETFAAGADADSWRKHAEWLAHPLDRPSWKALAKWRDACP